MDKLVYRKIVRSSLLLGVLLCAGLGLAGRAQGPEEGALGLLLDEPIIAFGGQDICQGECRPDGMMPPRLGFGPGFNAGPGPGGPPPFGGPGPHMGMFPPPPPGGPLMFAIGELDLSDDQLEKIDSIKNNTHEKVDPIMLKLHVIERDFHTALTQPAINIDAVSKLQAEMSAQKQLMESIFSDNIVAIAQILTPEQRKQLRQKQVREGMGPLGAKITPVNDKK